MLVFLSKHVHHLPLVKVMFYSQSYVFICFETVAIKAFTQARYNTPTRTQAHTHRNSRSALSKKSTFQYFISTPKTTWQGDRSPRTLKFIMLKLNHPPNKYLIFEPSDNEQHVLYMKLIREEII